MEMNVKSRATNFKTDKTIRKRIQRLQERNPIDIHTQIFCFHFHRYVICLTIRGGIVD